MYDANSLKEVNDTYGHAEGDLLLMAISTAVKSEMEPQDFPFRLSGDEFMIVFYNCSETRALKRMQKIESALAKQSASMNKPYPVSYTHLDVYKRQTHNRRQYSDAKLRPHRIPPYSRFRSAAKQSKRSACTAGQTPPNLSLIHI